MGFELLRCGRMYGKAEVPRTAQFLQNQLREGAKRRAQACSAGMPIHTMLVQNGHHVMFRLKLGA